ncbi:hypothetical protein SLE2022_073940 [Rubroshorea leprosula]
MNRARTLLVGLQIFLFCSDIVSLFEPPPPIHTHQPPPLFFRSKSQPILQQPLQFPTKKTTSVLGTGIGSIVNINFCMSCSYRGTAVTMKNMLEAAFPGISVDLANYPATFPKRLLSKVVPFLQVGLMGIIMAGERIFPKLGIMPLPAWYLSLRSNRFGSIASIWLLGNILQGFLQSSGAFEVYCNGELVFSKLMERRFPSEIELRDLVNKKLPNSRVVDGIGGSLWS